MISEIREVTVQQEHARRTDKSKIDLSMKNLKVRIDNVVDQHEAAKKLVSHVNDVMKLFLTAEFIQSRLDMHDAIDRGKISLIGCSPPLIGEEGRTPTCGESYPRPIVSAYLKAAIREWFHRQELYRKLIVSVRQTPRTRRFFHRSLR